MSTTTSRYGFPTNLISVLAGVFLLAMATSASAEPGERPCREDAAKLCKDVKPGGGAIAKCMKEHESELSPACKANMAKAKERVHEFKEDCKDDAHKLCKDVKPGEGRIVKCLKEHEGELSPSCKASMQRGKDRK